MFLDISYRSKSFMAAFAEVRLRLKNIKACNSHNHGNKFSYSFTGVTDTHTTVHSSNRNVFGHKSVQSRCGS